MDSTIPAINVSIVLFYTPIKDINNILDSLNQVKANYLLYIIDNSLTDGLKRYFIHRSNVVYIHNPSNPGFGASHNLALKESISNGILYHLVMNPDVYFFQDVITEMVNYLEVNQKTGMIMPQILNEDGTVQTLPKLLPTPFSVLFRKLKRPKRFYEKFIDEYELRKVPKDRIYNAPILSGCFTLFRIDALKEVGLYDDGFFMYFEDWDLSRRMHEKFETIYYPLVSVFHKYESGANKSKKLFKIFIKSGIRYFNKWGYFIDSVRKATNQKVLGQLK